MTDSAARQESLDDMIDSYLAEPCSRQELAARFHCTVELACQAVQIALGDAANVEMKEPEPHEYAVWDEEYSRNVNGYGMNLLPLEWTCYRKFWDIHRAVDADPTRDAIHGVRYGVTVEPLYLDFGTVDRERKERESE